MRQVLRRHLWVVSHILATPRFTVSVFKAHSRKHGFDLKPNV